MHSAIANTRMARVGLSLLASLIASCTLLLCGGAAHAAAAVTCPNANPIVNENNCMGEGTTENQSALENYSDDIGGFTTESSYQLGENVPLKIGTDLPSFPSTSINIAVYRIGYYGGDGARLIPTAGATKVAINNSFECNPRNPTTGEYSCSNWNVTYTIPGSKLPVSGVYEAVFTDLADGGIENYVIFTVRNDSSTSEVLDVIPTATYTAYNLFGCKSVYFDLCGGASTIAGDGRAVSVSFDRPLSEGNTQVNHFFGPDYNTVFWLEQQGYNVSYTEDIQTDSNPSSLLKHKIIVISGHSEYWSYNSFHNVKAARDAGVNVLSLSANTAYWQTRYENNHRTLVCYKTIQGTASGNPGGTPNDPTSLGPNGEWIPQNATTTRRDPGAPAGNPNAPPGGRVGINEPENSLWGNMYVGDNDENNFKLEIPSGNANGEFASSRVWRHTGLSAGSNNVLPENIVGWEWDQIPTQPGYLAQEPAGVKQITLTDVSKTGDTQDSWLQDAGRARASTPPPGEPANVSAVEYRAPSGALVFATGTMTWALGFDDEENSVIDQATYNVISEMGVQPATPAEDITLDTPGEAKPPWPSFTVAPTTAYIGEPVSFNASASSSPNGTITDYKWDLDNSGKFATDTGSTPTLTHTFTAPGTYKVILKVTDSKGQQETTARTVNISNTVTSKLSASMNPVGAGQQDTLSAAGSTSTGGTITDYKWDLDGNGTYETDTATTPTVNKTFSTPGTYTVGLQVTDSHGAISTSTLSITVLSHGVSRYSDAVLAVPSLLHYYRFDEASGSTIADSKGNAPGTLSEALLGVPGAVNGDPGTSVEFSGDGDPFEGEPGSYGAIPMDLSKQSSITVEFWLKWDAYGNNDSLAMELTPNYNEHEGGFIVDPDASEFGGTFGVGVGVGGSRNSVFFARPTAGVWHHYAMVIDPTQPAATQITPYVDGQPISYQKESSGTGAGNFANSTLYLFSRGGTSLFGSGSLDELAIYSGDLSAGTVLEQFDSNGPEPRPVASFTATPNPPKAGQTVTLNGSSSHYSGGSIVKYEWDLNGDGTYETNTGANATTTTSFANPGTYTVGLRVTDSDGSTGVSSQQISVGSFPPAVHVKVSPNPALTGQTVTLNASESTDQGTITDYKWDLDNSGKFATDTGSTPTVTTSFTTIGVHTVGVQLTDSEGLTSTTTIPVTVLAQGVTNYEEAVQNTPGLTDYYKLGEPHGPTIFDSKGSKNGTITGGTFGLPGAVKEDSTTAIGFNGSTDSGAVPLNLSNTSQLTIEFWLKWNQYANNDALAMEFTPNFNENSGGFLVDPNAPELGGTFGVGIGSDSDRNVIFFQRPSAGVWHHYAIVINTNAEASKEITPYVDGEAVSYQQEVNSSGQGNFANSTLYLMSRDGNSLFGAGALDQLAIYNQALSASTVFQHFESYGSSQAPTAAFTVTPNPARPEQNVTLNASTSSDPDGTIVDYQWDLDGNGTYETDTGSNPTLTTSFATAGTRNISLRVVDNHAASSTAVHALTVGNLPPAAHVAITPNPAIVGQTVTLDASKSTDQGTITDYKWDLDNSGKFATDTGSTPTVTTSFATPGTHLVGVELTDDHSLSSRTTVAVTVLEQANKSYTEAVTSTPGLIDYYKLGESVGPSISDSVGLANGTITGGTFGLPGAVQPATAIGFNGTSDSGTIPLNLSSTNQVTIEFWLKWNQYANNDALAMEFTPNFNENEGGFLVDPNAGEYGGTFGISIGTDGTRNGVFFQRPSVGVWHHYAIVLNTSAESSKEITPYVDGEPVSFQQESGNIGQGNFANSTLYLFSRGGNSLFGTGAMQDLAIYNQTLSASTIFSHYHAKDVDLSLVPSFTATPSSAVTGENVTLNASESTDSQGTITDYRWDLDNSGNYATDSGSSPTLTHAFGTPGTYIVGLQTTDSTGAVAKTTLPITITQAPPSKPELTISGAAGNTLLVGNTVYYDPQSGNSGSFTVAASTSDPFSGIKNVTFPTLSGFSGGGGVDTSTPYTTTYTWSGSGANASGTQTVTATNNANISSSSSFTLAPDNAPPSGGALTVNGTSAAASASTSYSLTGSYTIARTDFSEPQSPTQSGLKSSTLTVASASLAGNVCGTFGTPTTLTGSPSQTEPSGCYRYTLTGVDNLGNSTSLSTIVRVDSTRPTTPALSFSGLSANTFYKSSTNALYFSPSANGTYTVTASSTDPETGIAGYTFSSLATNGFASEQVGGKMVYTFGISATQPAIAPTILATSNAGATSANATYSLIADTTGPTGGALTVNNTAGTAAGSTSYSTSGSFTIGTRTDFNADGGSGFVSSALTRASGTLSENNCTNFGTPATITGNPSQSGLAAGCYLYKLTGLDRVGNASVLQTTVKVDKTAPVATISAPAFTNAAVPVTFSATDAGGSGLNSAAGQLKRSTSTYTASSNSCGSFFLFSNIGSLGLASPFTDSTASTGHCYEYEYSVSDHAGNSTTSPGATVRVNTAKPTLTSITDTTPGTTTGLPQVGNAITLTFSDTIEASSVPSTVTLTYSRGATGSTTVAVSGIGSSTAWSTGDPTTARYSKVGGTSAVVSASTAVSGTTVKLTITSISDPSGNLTAGGPGAVNGVLNGSLKDVFGNTASTSSFTTSSIRLF